MTSNKGVQWLGRLLMILSILFVGWQISRNPVDFSAYLSPMSLTACILTVLLLAGGIALNAYAFQRMLEAVAQKRIAYDKVLYVYAQANLYKYLPGNVMQYVGRNRLAVNEDVTHASVALSSLLEIVCMALTGGLLALALAFRPLVQWLQQYPPFSVGIAFAGALVLLTAAALLFRKKFVRQARKYFGILSSKGCVHSLLRNCLAMAVVLLLNGGMFYVLLRLLAPETSNAASIIGLYIMAWLLGFITPGAPGGVGIREAVLTMFLGSLLPRETILATLVVSRVLSIAGDIAGFGAAAWIHRARRGKRNNPV